MSTSIIAMRAVVTPAMPTREQPGTLGQQLEALELYWQNPYRHHDQAAAWQLARRLTIPHARRAV